MPLPDALLGLIHQRRFWTDYMFWTEAGLEDYPELEEDDAHRIEFHVVDYCCLVLDVSSFLGVITLNFTSMLDDEIAHDDRAHWCPHVLRWGELELICKLIAAEDETLPHPGLPLLLLYRFAPICIGDDVDRIVSMLTRAWRSLGIFRDAEILRFIEKTDRRDGPDGEFRWVSEEVEVEDEEWVSDAGSVDDAESAASQPLPETGVAGKDEHSAQAPTLEVARGGEEEHGEAKRDDQERQSASSEAPEDAEPDGGKLKVTKKMQTHWYIEQPESMNGLYTTRWKGEDSFPHQAWEDMISAAKQALAETGDASTGPVADDADELPKLQLRTTHKVELDIPLGKEVPMHVCSLTVTSLDRMLDSLNLGGAGSTGSRSCQRADGKFVTTNNYVSVSIFGDLDRGLQIVRQTLWWARIRASAQLRGKERKDNLPLSLEPAPEPSVDGLGPLHLQAIRLWAKDPGSYWPVGFDESLPRNGLQTAATLNDLGLQIEGPDQDFWYKVTAADGGESRFCFGIIEQIDENLSSCTLEVSKLTPGTAEVLYRFLREHKLALFPMRIVVEPPDDTIGKIVHYVAGHEELFQILSAGPSAWWQADG